MRDGLFAPARARRSASMSPASALAVLPRRPLAVAGLVGLAGLMAVATTAAAPTVVPSTLGGNWSNAALWGSLPPCNTALISLPSAVRAACA